MAVDGETVVREPRFPHEILEAYVRERLGRVVAVFGEDADKMLRPLTLGLTEQLSSYCDIVGGARLRLGDVTIREGACRSYIFADLTDRGAPLRLRDAMERFDGADYVGDNVDDFAWAVNARRWRFIDRYFGRLLDPLIKQVGTHMLTYYARRPYAKPQVGILRLLEGVDKTTLCIEFDDRSVDPREDVNPKDTRGRYQVQ